MKERCELCDAARQVLAPLEQDGRLIVELVDIERDPDLFRRFCLIIPVLELASGRRFEWPFGRAELSEALP